MCILVLSLVRSLYYMYAMQLLISGNILVYSEPDAELHNTM